jgi:hypothetical protein
MAEIEKAHAAESTAQENFYRSKRREQRADDELFLTFVPFCFKFLLARSGYWRAV